MGMYSNEGRVRDMLRDEH